MVERLVDLTWDAAQERLVEVKAVIIPLGSCEQHGYHLPLGTDITLGQYISEQVAELVDGIVLPIMPFGQVWSAKSYPGTISISSDTLKLVLKEVSVSLERHGVKRIVFISGHLGNLPVMKDTARELLVVCPSLKTSFFCYPNYKQMADGIMDTKLWNGSVFHAGEIETSLMLAVDSNSCQMDRAVIEFPPVPEELDFRPIPWNEFNKSGVFGDAKSATAAKGQKFLDRLIPYLAKIIKSDLERGE